MNNILKKIESIMTSKRKAGLISFESFLFMLSLSYGGAVKTRETFYKKGVLKSKKLPCIVISIGNITVGGTGKTPMTIYMAKLVKSLGYKVAIISRGYKGGAEKTGGIVSDGRKIFMGPDAAGDEPYLIAMKLKDFPVLVGEKRFETGMLAIRRFNPDILVLDDAFQHLQLKRDLNIVLLDTSCPFGNGHLLPRGILREPLYQLKRADAFVITRTDRAESFSGISTVQKMIGKQPMFQCMHVFDNLSKIDKEYKIKHYELGLLRHRKIVAFCGIARNEDFRKLIYALECDVADFLMFPDHHFYLDRDLNMILRSAQKAGADCLLTTEKDYVKIAHRRVWPFELFALGIKISFGHEETFFNTFIENRLVKLEKTRRV